MKDIDKKILLRWQAMMKRCYDKEWKTKNPTYHDAKVCDEWHNYTSFRNWAIKYIKQIELGWDLDKDLMSGNQRIYSPDTCVFLPAEINRTLPKFRIWTEGKVDSKSSNIMKIFGKALEDGKDLIPTVPYEKLFKIVSDYRKIYEAKKTKIKKPRGGHREGSGRKATPYKIPLMVRITKEAADKISNTNNKSEFIDNLIKYGVTTIQGKPLCDYTDAELRDELVLRGYRGRLSKGELLLFGNF